MIRPVFNKEIFIAPILLFPILKRPFSSLPSPFIIFSLPLRVSINLFLLGCLALLNPGWKDNGLGVPLKDS